MTLFTVRADFSFSLNCVSRLSNDVIYGACAFFVSSNFVSKSSNDAVYDACAFFVFVEIRGEIIE